MPYVEFNTSICVEEIPGCHQYHSETPANCYACLPGFTATGDSPAISACVCANPTTGTTGIEICPGDIDNCEVYSEVDPNTCHTCVDGYTGSVTHN